MRLLTGHSQHMVRLGWLRLIARIVGAESMPRSVLAQKLVQVAKPHVERWLEEADLRVKPRGSFSEDIAHRFPGIAERFGIYDAATEQLTDLGRVLFFADGAYRQVESPFAWPTPLRYLGLRVLLGADGDLLLAILRAWPRDGRLSHPLDFIADVASKLLSLVDQAMQRDELRRLAVFRGPGSKAAHWSSTYPLLEPLRELGYATRDDSGTHGGQYTLTARGVALATAVREGEKNGRSADAILVEGLGSLFSTAENKTVTEETSLEPIRKTLLGLPDMLLGGLLNEAPLEPVVLITMARLLATGAATSVEVARTRALLLELGRQSGGRIALKQGRMAWEANIAWTSRDCLLDPALFRIKQPVMRGRSLSVESAPPVIPETSSEISVVEPTSETAVVEPASETAVVELTSETAATEIVDTSAVEPRDGDPSPEPIAEARSTEFAVDAPPPIPVAATTPALLPSAPPHVVRWLQYVGRLLDVPLLGGYESLSAGAPSSWIERLRRLSTMQLKYLDGKRAAQDLSWPTGGKKIPAAASPPSAYLPARWCEQLDGIASLGFLRSALDAWSDAPTGVRLLRVALDRAADTWERDGAAELREQIEKFLDGPDAGIEENAWDRARWMTAAWVEDQIDRNLASREELKRRLHLGARNGLSREAAAALFAGESGIQCMTVTRIFRVPRVIASHIPDDPEKALEVGSPPTILEPVFDVDDSTPEGAAEERGIRRRRQPDTLRVTVEVEASSRDLAIARALEQAWDALKKVRFLIGSSEIAVYRDEDGLAAKEVESVLVDGEDVPAVEPLASNARLALAPRFPRLNSPPFTMEQLAEVDHQPLSRTLHWLAAADQVGLGPAHRLSNVWVAMEHLIVEQDEEHGPAVARTLADVGALCRLEALAGVVTRELCEALRHTRRLRGTLPNVAAEVQKWEAPIREFLGEDTRSAVYDDASTVPAFVADHKALAFLLSRETTDLNPLRDLLASDTPIAAFAIRQFSRDVLGKAGDFAVWLRSTRREIQSLVLHAYEVRNLLFHNGMAFGFGDAARLQNLYARLRLVVDAVVMRFATALVRTPGREVVPGELWAELRIGVRDLLRAADSIALDKDRAKTDNPLDRETLRRALLTTTR